MWSRHLKLFKYLKTYNDGLIKRNLLFIFFVICFPFTASVFTVNIQQGFSFPIFIYLGNILVVNCTYFLLCYYLFKQKKSLCILGFETEKKYSLMQTGSSSILLTITMLLVVIAAIVFKGELKPIMYSIYILVILQFFAQRKLKKYKPRSEN